MPAALISQMDPPPGERQAFEDWYASEHVPLRMAVSGFRGAVRGWAVQGEPQHLVVYWMDDLGVLESPAYREMKDHPSDLTRHMLENVAAFTRWTGRRSATPARRRHPVGFSTSSHSKYPGRRSPSSTTGTSATTSRWLMGHGGWLRVRRYAISAGEPAGVTRVALHELAGLDALDSPERARARSSQWRARLAENPWFASVRYAVYERHQDFAPDR